MNKTPIEWTGLTWNPVTGCTKVSSGCDHCYAHTLANRPFLSRLYLPTLPANDTPENRADPFAVRLWLDRLGEPASIRKPSMIFVNSMSDLFHVDVPDSFIRQVFEAMLSVDRHIYQVLTKRPARALRFFRANCDLFPARGGIPPHIWMGTSVESDDVAYRIRQLQDVPAEVRFLTCEPLLGDIELDDLQGIAQVICGGESGDGFRPLSLDHARSLRDQCTGGGVPFLFKQVGGRTPKAGGRELDGRTHDGYPLHPYVQAWFRENGKAVAA